MTTVRNGTTNATVPLMVLGGSVAVALAWSLTPRYGPWLCHGVFGLVMIALVLRHRPALLSARWSLRAGISGTLVGLALAVASWAITPPIVQLIPGFESELKQLYATLRRPPGPFAASPLLVLTICVEELLWRGQWIEWLNRRMPTVAAITVATLSYALPIAASRSILLFAVASGLGAVLTIERLFVETWLAPAIAHVIWAVLVLVVHPIV
jgi:membrane protease YdiL (CAAX protease family)